MPETAYLPDPREQPLTWLASRNYGNTAPQQVYIGAAPPAAPDDPTLPALFYPNSLGPMQQWSVLLQAWG